MITSEYDPSTPPSADSLPDPRDFYEEAGIRDLAGFYAERFTTGGVFDACYFNPLDRFHMQFARTMWVYDNVREGSSLLDIGCGEGLLALLKRKGVRLAGVDLSPQLAEVARRNGYDEVRVAPLVPLPFPDAAFDYVASLDVLGHIEFAGKDELLREIKRVMRPGGTTLHGIECFDAVRFISYETMSEAERAAFVGIDGHIGLETEAETGARFARHFEHVSWESRYTLCMSSEEFIKQAERYGRPYEEDFLDYLRGLSFRERRAFDMAMGYVFAKVSDLHIKLPDSGLYMLLKASERPLGSFYNEHRERAALLGTGAADDAGGSPTLCLDRSPRARFDEGWYAANDLPPVARWMGERGRIYFTAPRVSKLRLALTTHIPDLHARPLRLDMSLDGVRCASLSLVEYGWLEIELMPAAQPDGNPHEPPTQSSHIFEITAARTWQPARADATSTDDREISIAVCNTEVFL